MKTNNLKIAEILINGYYHLGENENRTMQKISDAVDYAWNNWDEDVLKTYYEGDKPEQPTKEFINQWVDNEDFEADGYDVDHLIEIFE